jgi:hypothetical protein
MPKKKKPPPDPVRTNLSGEGPRGEVAGCPTALGGVDPPLQPAAPPGDNAGLPTKPSPGEGLTEEQRKRSGLD